MTARIDLTLRPIAEYVAAGGDFDDSGNGGEAWNEAEQAEFVGCLAPGDAAPDPLSRAAWRDSTNGWILYRSEET